MHRFLIPTYFFNSIRIKAKALALSLKHNASPYHVYSEEIEIKDVPAYELEFKNKYLSLSYFDLESAEQYYGQTSLITSDIILAIVEYNEMLADKDVDIERLRELASNIEERGEWEGDKLWFLVETHLPKFNLDGDTHSGIIQSKAASLFLRVYQQTGDKKYLKWARAALLPCTVDIKKGGLHIRNEGINSWVEEYKTETPSMVLNGYIFVLIALAEYLTFDKNVKFQKIFEQGVSTTLAWLPYYQKGGDVLYSMYNWDLCNIHYMGVSLYQIKHLYRITKLKGFKKYLKYLKAHTDLDLFLDLTNNG